MHDDTASPCPDGSYPSDRRLLETVNGYLDATTAGGGSTPSPEATLVSFYLPMGVLLPPASTPVVGREAILDHYRTHPWWCAVDRQVVGLFGDGNRVIVLTRAPADAGDLHVAEVMSFDRGLILQHRVLADSRHAKASMSAMQQTARQGER